MIGTYEENTKNDELRFDFSFNNEEEIQALIPLGLAKC